MSCLCTWNGHQYLVIFQMTKVEFSNPCTELFLLSMPDRFHILSYRVLSSDVPWLFPCHPRNINRVSRSVPYKSSRFWICRYGQKWFYRYCLSDWRRYGHADVPCRNDDRWCTAYLFIPIFSMYSRAICAIHSLLSLGESCTEKLREICPTTLLTRGFNSVWSMKLWTIWLIPSVRTPNCL